jgi:hypothetical protein
LPEPESQSSETAPIAGSGVLGQWLDLQPVVDEVVAKVLVGRQTQTLMLPEWFMAAIPNDGVKRTREELVEIAAAAIEQITKLDAAGG